MKAEEQIKAYIDSQREPKRTEMQNLHQRMLQILPGGKLWFLDGKDDTGKVVTNPNIGYGTFDIYYKDGSNKEFYQIGLSGNTTGISVYIMGLKDKKNLPNNFGTTIGKASVTGYCIKFKTLEDINLEVLEAAIRYGIEQTSS
ncbi:DUF1801 domain-containing protein [Flavilitoribacter nigricans]|uniref:Uncharacterized protein n=1 Tax=Flavilitoribacter nigricans (strain ATCC 23147 / DSM 23189 / NBRC 102662 / NCIMB 1420 / SS-2) TaxID=1122177 RepID=A0A2D0N2A2_FLAN2|nr:DUF1801 domain-containing protein [Flavilitoribacter nigricans]PHN02540.1 hypothetical protein CRP01_31690 [Flavilitoribacter nigricans DSM 23189 = NBRC 102662]